MEWVQRIGGDHWRNLIWEETQIVKDLNSKKIVKELNSKTKTRAIDLSNSGVSLNDKGKDWREEVFSIAYPLNDADNPDGRAYLVYQVGRLFCIGAPENLRNQLGDLLPTHIILLSWSKEHTAGLSDLLKAYGENNKPAPAIWTSAWLWSELLLSSSVENYSGDRLFGEDDIERRLQDQHFIQQAVITFERELNVEFTPGVSVYLEYTSASIPGLRVTFRCNGLEITLDPLNEVLKKDETKGLCDKLEARTQIAPELKELCTFRISKIHQRETEKPEENKESDVYCGRSTKRDTSSIAFNCLKPDLEWRLPEIVATDMLGKRSEDIKFSIDEDYSPVDGIVSKGGGKVDLSIVGVAIMCGQLGHQKDQLDPARLLSLPDGRVVSILQWHLENLLKDLSKNSKNFRIHVLLVTTPETDSLVRQELAILKQGRGDIEGDNENSERDITYLQRSNINQNIQLEIHVSEQSLVPRVKEKSKTEPLEPAKFDDGGWDLHSRGHLDVLRTLIYWKDKDDEIPDNWLAVPFNNLGQLFNEETWTRLNTVASTDTNSVAVEVFKFQLDNESKKYNPDDGRWGFMSFLSGSDKKDQYLHKADYVSEKNANKNNKWPHENESWSSHTWYFNLPKLTKIFTSEPDNIFKEYIFSSGMDIESEHEVNNSVFDLRQDIDQITSQKGIRFSAIESSEPEKKQTGLYANDRFMVVRREDDLRNTQFFERFSVVHNDRFTKEDNQNQNDNSGQFVPPVFEVLPAALHYIWGGKRLRREMELSEGSSIAEVWFASTHSNGPSLVPKNHRDLVPLKTFIGGELPFIFKYLDCFDKLSIQVHPNNSVAKFLTDEKKYSLQDDRGKEEAFYVLNAPNRAFHLFMGFEKSELADLAAKLRPVLENHAFDIEQKLDKTIEKIAQKVCDHTDEVFWDEVVSTMTCGDSKVLEKPEKKCISEDDNIKGVDLKEIIKFHLDWNIISETGQDQDRLKVLGKEYLLAAVGFVGFLEQLSLFFRDSEISSQLQKNAANKIFSYQLKNNESDDERKKRPLFDHPLLKYFHTEKIDAGKWGRVPPGVVHSWQGDGNFLIEIGQSSDNTFRIFDFGRELSNLTAREMHYREALYALTEDAIFGKESAKNYIVDQEKKRIHSEIDCKTLGGEELEYELSQAKDYSVVMNPHNPAVIQATKEVEVEEKAECRLGCCRAAIIVPETTKGKVWPEARSDSIFQFYDRRDAPDGQKRWEDLLCISLRATKQEYALRLDGCYPEAQWIKACPKSNDTRKWLPIDIIDHGLKFLNAELMQWVRVILKNMDGKRKLKGKRGHRILKVCVSWPGFVKSKKEGGKLYTTHFASNDFTLDDFKKEVREKVQAFIDTLPNNDKENEWCWKVASDVIVKHDAEVAAMGEHRHNLGGLVKDKPGMVLNVGSGVCAGFYPGKYSLKQKADEQEDSSKQESDDLVTAISAVGRWLYVNIDTREMALYLNGSIKPVKSAWEAPVSDLSQLLGKQVFQDEIPIREGSWVRVSAYLSSQGLATRFVHRAGEALDDIKQEITDEEDKATEESKKLKSSINWILANVPEGSLEDRVSLMSEGWSSCRFLSELNALVGGEEEISGITYDFIITVAAEFAEVIRCIRVMISKVTDEETARKWTRRVILTGDVGQYFGRVAVDEEEGKVKDLFLEFLNKILESSSCKVRRSEIAISSLREVAGFEEIVWLWDSTNLNKRSLKNGKSK